MGTTIRTTARHSEYTGKSGKMQSGIAERAEPATFVPAHQIEERKGMTPASGPEANFERVKAQLKARLGNDVYSSWFGRMKIAEASRGLIRLSVPTAFLRQWINNHYLDLIAELWKQGDPGMLKLEIVVRSATRSTAPHVEEARPPRRRSARFPPACRRRRRHIRVPRRWRSRA